MSEVSSVKIKMKNQIKGKLYLNQARLQEEFHRTQSSSKVAKKSLTHLQNIGKVQVKKSMKLRRA